VITSERVDGLPKAKTTAVMLSTASGRIRAVEYPAPLPSHACGQHKHEHQGGVGEREHGHPGKPRKIQGRSRHRSRLATWRRRSCQRRPVGWGAHRFLGSPFSSHDERLPARAEHTEHSWGEEPWRHTIFSLSLTSHVFARVARCSLSRHLYLYGPEPAWLRSRRMRRL
jgi:hypothetical protein